MKRAGAVRKSISTSFQCTQLRDATKLLLLGDGTKTYLGITAKSIWLNSSGTHLITFAHFGGKFCGVEKHDAFNLFIVDHDLYER